MDIIYGYLTQILSMKAIKLGFSLCIAGFSYLVGGIDIATKACMMLILADFFFGFSIACYQGKFSGKRMMQGLVKIILYGVAMIVGNQIDLLIFHSTVEFGAKNLIILYIGINDGISVLKHLGQAGLRLPQKLIERLQGFQDTLDIDFDKKP